MKWIPVKPDTMPPELEPVIVSVRHDFGDGQIGKWVDANIRWSHDKGWEYLADAYNNEWWYYSGGRDITHWAHMPEPVFEDGEKVAYIQKHFTGQKFYHLLED